MAEIVKPKTKFADLEAFFKDAKYPTGSLQFDVGVVITNCKIFVESHMKFLRAHRGERLFLPYFLRLVRLKEILEEAA